MRGIDIKLAYGKKCLNITLPEEGLTIIEPKFVPGIPDEKKAFVDSLNRPIGSPPLKELIKSKDNVAIVFSDLTRPVPNRRIIPWLLEELSGVSKDRIVLINATGMHRANTIEELTEMLGEEVVRNYRIVNHNAQKKEEMVRLGKTKAGGDIWVNGNYIRAGVKILTGFIEPHFFAGFSGGPKSVLPGISGEDTIMHNHSANMLNHPKADWSITRGNPLWEEIREVALMTKPTFIINVTLNKEIEISGVFSGDMDLAHQKGVEFARESAMRAVPHLFDLVITTNSGYPLDLNLYQTVKGMSAASQIVKKGGAIICVSECSDGIPEHGNYRRILQMGKSPEEILKIVGSPGFSMFDQWEAQIQAEIQTKARVYLYSELPEKDVVACHLEPIKDIEGTVERIRKDLGNSPRIAVLPEGPMTIPYLSQTS
ncbi:MAG: nickel-dependent lactate racemase [Elusimicrobiota bacterium]|nr:nickel-dependent lactate racemase [Elusimicrobiota bacterium]